MPKGLRIRQRADGSWIADHPELLAEEVVTYPDPQAPTPMTLEQIREALLSVLDVSHPGEYSLDVDLPYYRGQAFEKINARTAELIALGFSFAGAVFSLSLEAQVRYTAMLLLAAQIGPLTINSLDDEATANLATPEDVQLFCGGALSRVRELIDSGTTQKDWARAQNDWTALVQYTDPRVVP